MADRPDDNQETAAIMECAHRLWMGRMVASGWRYGPRYNRAERTHDCLLPLSEIPAEDRAEAQVRLEAIGIAETLVETLEYDRGASRPLRAGEMRKGLRVRWIDGIELLGDLAGSREGVVVDWRLDPQSGLLLSASILWDNGATCDEDPGMPTVVRADELPGGDAAGRDRPPPTQAS